mmetsp:Transcript_155936/g.499937  ORF Transcript_155936/g.499937 Transcript_155936/m.499937 type:complete len:1220 (+) Transcript_155936:362-4021(+)
MLPLRSADPIVIDLDEDVETDVDPIESCEEDDVDVAAGQEAGIGVAAAAASASASAAAPSASATLAAALRGIGPSSSPAAAAGRTSVAASAPLQRHGSTPATPPQGAAAVASDTPTPKKATRGSPRGGPPAAAADQEAVEPSPVKRQCVAKVEPWLADVAASSGSASSGARPARPWLRTPAAPLDARGPLRLFLVTLDERLEAPPPGFPAAGGAGAAAPVLELHGATRDGQSVLLHVHGFLPYFYARPPPCVAGSGAAALDACAQALNTVKHGVQVVANIEEVRRTPLMPYQAHHERLLRISVTNPKLIASCRSALERGLRLRSGAVWQTQPLETNVAFCVRFLVDLDLGGGSWLEIPGGRYQVRDARSRKSTATVEADVHHTALVAHKAEGEWIGLPPLRVLSLHLTLAGEGEAQVVVAAGAQLQMHGQGSPLHQVAWVRTSDGAMLADPDAGVLRSACGRADDDCQVQLFAFRSESELLLHIRDYVIESDADVLIGYDLLNVHLTGLLGRAEAAGLVKRGGGYGLGRLLGVTSRAKSSTFESKQLGKQETKEVNVEGRLLFDVLTIVEREQKLTSYSLSAVALQILSTTRLELRSAKVASLSKERPELLAAFALRDAGLVFRIFDAQHVLFRYVEMARVTGVPIEYLVTRGQSVKVFSMLLRKARAHGYVLPPPPAPGQDSETSYEGGCVLDPKVGFYEEPVVTLDFASLYPSIMMRHNLCYSTLLPDSLQAPEPQGGEPGFETVPDLGHRFVTSRVRRGLIPMVLEELLAARAKAKKDLKSAKDPQTRAVLDGRQLALKMSANSVYGFTGMSVGTLPCVAIAASVTAYGRKMIERTRSVVEERFCVARGYPRDARVIYGDTDSVMVSLGKGCEMSQAFAFGKEAAEVVSGEFGAPIKMEFEKVYTPYLLMNKKRYAGVAWAQPGEAGKLDAKGIETVRRDWCQLVREVVDRCLHLILRERSPEQGIEYVRETLAQLRQGRVDPRQLVLSKALVRDGAQAYDSKQVHVELAERIRRRSPALAPQVGDRVPYVFVAAAQGVAAYERAEDPLWALEHGLPIDAEYYVEHQLKGPLLRIFGPVLGSEAAAKQRLFGGDAARPVAVRAPSGSGPLASFARARPKCLGCRTILHEPGQVLCSSCEAPERAVEVVLRHIEELRPLEAEASQLLSQCARCEGSHFRGLNAECANVDCPIFFRRLQVSRELDGAQCALQKLQLDW